MPGFVPENPPTLGLAGAFDLQHLAPLEAHEAGMREVERNGEAENAIRAEELLRQPGMQGDDTARLQPRGAGALPPRHHRALNRTGRSKASSPAGFRLASRAREAVALPACESGVDLWSWRHPVPARRL